MAARAFYFNEQQVLATVGQTRHWHAAAPFRNAVMGLAAAPAGQGDGQLLVEPVCLQALK